MAPLLPSQQQSQPQMRRSNSRARSQKIGRVSVLQAGVLCATSAVIAFYLGMVLGSSAATHSSNAKASVDNSPEGCFTEEQVQVRVAKALASSNKSPERNPVKRSDSVDENRFPDGMARLVVASAQVDRDDFAKKFNLGVPLDTSDPTNNKVLMMYSRPDAVPSEINGEAGSLSTLPLISAENATENCDFMHIVLQDHSGNRRQCMAVFGQYEAFHIQKLMRLPENGRMDSNVPLRVVNRGAQSSGRKSTKAPTIETTLAYWKILQIYLGHLDDLLKILKPIAEKIAVKNTVIVQVCNHGQSELLLNFLCSAKQRGLDTSLILVFATDQETYDLVHAMDSVTVFYDEVLFGAMPVKAAARYGDRAFMLMMMAKIYCVQLINMLGYDVLFQDVDVVWYKNPLAYFHDENAEDANFDIYFQDDGNHAIYYAPYSANTGFYYVRNNVRTQYFFNSFLMAGDLVMQTKSHQVPLVALLQEHSSMYGLNIKIFPREGDLFPGGHAYHRRKAFVKDMLNGKVHPQIFHMSWTSSKVNKRKFLQQMGEWYLQDTCRDKKLIDILGGKETANFSSDCCAAEPLVVCHYRDKPSKIPCKESPAIDNNGRSFW